LSSCESKRGLFNRLEFKKGSALGIACADKVEILVQRTPKFKLSLLVTSNRLESKTNCLSRRHIEIGFPALADMPITARVSRTSCGKSRAAFGCIIVDRCENAIAPSEVDFQRRVGFEDPPSRDYDVIDSGTERMCPMVLVMSSRNWNLR